MYLRIEELKDVCSTILPAVDSAELSSITETLELEIANKVLYLRVTNREYFVEAKLKVDTDETFKATVNANLFLRLVSQTTAESIELLVDNTSLIFKGNGTYKIPLIFDREELLVLPRIDIKNVTAEFDIDSEILNSIMDYNSKQITIGTLSKPVQKMFYIDEKGAVTFTSGACVNSFTLPKPVKMLVNLRLVKLFKLFKEGKVQFKLGYDAISEDIIQTKVRFENSKICITAILSCDDTMLASVPVDAIRNRANSAYTYSVTLDKNVLIDTISRMKLFISSMKAANNYGKFVFDKDKVCISDRTGENKEELMYNNDTTSIEEPYELYLDLNELLAVLDTCSGSHVVVKFGDKQAITINRGNIINVIPETRIE